MKMSLAIVGCCFLLLVSSTVVSASKLTNFAANRSALVHLFEWKWNDVAEECERFLGPMGFAGVQISPIQENVVLPARPWYERYQPISYLWRTRSGNETELRSMFQRCNKAGVRVYVDVVMNHMSADQPNEIISGTGGSEADPRHRSYPTAGYNVSDFHPFCNINDYNNAAQVRNCELVGLHDLDQSKQHVRDTLIKFLNDVIDAGVAGFRVDAAKHMWPRDLAVIYSSLKNVSEEHGFAPGTRPYIFQEVIDYGSGEAVSKYEYNSIGSVTEFRHGREISRALMGQNELKWFQTWGEKWGMLPSSDALVFIDNHDTQRDGGQPPLTYKNPKLYKMAVAFMLAHPYGTPRIMSSYAFDENSQGPPSDSNGNIVSPPSADESANNSCSDSGWVCEHRWPQVHRMVAFRNAVESAPKTLTRWWDNSGNQIAFCRGELGFIAINAEPKLHLRRRLRVCLPPGKYCDVISGEVVSSKDDSEPPRCSGKSIKVDTSGWADIRIRTDDEDGVVAYHVGARIA